MQKNKKWCPTFSFPLGEITVKTELFYSVMSLHINSSNVTNQSSLFLHNLHFTHLLWLHLDELRAFRCLAETQTAHCSLQVSFWSD